MRQVSAGLVALVAAVIWAAPASAAPGLTVGLAEDNLKWRTAESVAVARDLGVTAFRVTVRWNTGQTVLDGMERTALDRAVPASWGLRLVVSVLGPAREPPVDAAGRSAYCSFVRSLLERYPTIRDVVVWNEVNLSMFWQPQYDELGRSLAPAHYQALLGECWDAVHAVRPDANLVTTTSPRGNDDPSAVSNVSHAPATFIRRMGEAYRAGGRARPLFDTVGHNVYGHSSERPWKQHLGSTHLAQGDLEALLGALRAAFGGTAQPLPEDCGGRSGCPGVWYLEAGYQTSPSAEKAHLYGGRETDAFPLADRGAGDADGRPRDADGLAPDQATQLVDGLRLAYCQPYVQATFNFLLWDEPDLGRWQSGLLWADGTRKGSYDAFRDVAAEIADDAVDCTALRRTQLPGARSGRVVERVAWQPRRSFPRRHKLWWFRVAVRGPADFRAVLVRLGPRRELLRASGTLRPGAFRFVRFYRQRLRAGSYRIELVVSSSDRALAPARYVGPRFRVR